MAYIGKQPVVGNFVKLDDIVTSATATYNLLNGGVAYYPQTANNCIVSLNGVIQSPTSAYTISGSTIVFDSALTSSDSIDFILVLGDVLSIGTPSDGTVTSAKLASGTDGLFAWQSVQTTGFTAVAARAYPCNTTSAAFTVTLPASPSVGDQVLLLDYAGTFDTNNLTVNPNSNKLEGGTTNLLLSGDREGVTLTYIDSTQGWLATSGIQEGTDSLSPIIYSADFLVVAGGGGGGGVTDSPGGGGGGAGGYRTSTQSVNGGTVITVTVGDGGAGSTGNPAGSNGSDSSISGSGLTTITSAGGGYGGCRGSSSVNANSGGSGGGRAGYQSALGSGNTPSTSPSQGNNGGDQGGNQGAGGGGGASAVGSNGSVSTGGAGGAGTASSITGSSVSYSGGGGGGSGNSTSASGGAGGTGGGGRGGNSVNSAGGESGVSGTANTGGGGGGGAGGTAPTYTTQTGGNGGKGVVILSVPTANYSATSTGSPTITTSGSNTILKFTGSGTYTA
jgi:hypothetical protein